MTPSTKYRIAGGLARSPALAAASRRGRTERPPIGLALSIVAFTAVVLWAAASAAAHLIA